LINGGESPPNKPKRNRPDGQKGIKPIGTRKGAKDAAYDRSRI